MNKIGPTTRALGLDILSGIKLVHKVGFNHIDIFVEPPFICPLITKKSELREIKESGKKHGVTFTFHLGFSDMNSATLNEPLRQNIVKELCWSVDAASYLDAETATIHGGHYYYAHRDNLKKEAFEKGVESLFAVQKRAKKNGVTLCLENLDGEQSIFKSYRHLEEALREIPEIALTYDISHIHPNSQVDFIRQFRSHIKHIHISDSTKTRNHLAFGKGNINFDEVLSNLEWYKGAFSLEGGCGLPKNLEHSKKFMEKRLKKIV